MGKQGIGEDWEFISTIDHEVAHPANTLIVNDDFNHKLNFAPVIFAQASYDSGTKFYPLPVVLVNESGGDEGTVYEALITFSSTTQIGISLYTPQGISNTRYASEFTIPIRFYLFRFRASS